MKLIDLQPRWLLPNTFFIFKCPHCQDRWLTCKNFTLATHKETFKLLEELLGESWNEIVVPPKAGCAWQFESVDFGTMSVTPSIDASASGHWHGFITNGQIVG